MRSCRYLKPKYLAGEIFVAILLAFGTVGARNLVFPVNKALTFQSVATVLGIGILLFPLSMLLFWITETLQKKLKKEK